MRKLPSLNIKESVEKRKLIFKEEWTDKLDRFTVYLFFSGFIYCPILILKELDLANPNESFIAFTILPLSSLFGTYVIYRKATEKYLFKINTKLSQELIKVTLLEYAKKQSLDVYRNSKECLILNESADDFDSSHIKSTIIFIENKLILFTIIQDRYRLNLPVLLSHLFLKKDLKKLFEI